MHFPNSFYHSGSHVGSNTDSFEEHELMFDIKFVLHMKLLSHPAGLSLWCH